MSIKMEPPHHPTKVLPCALLNSGVLRLAGRDAIVFSQAQFANDVALLADGQWQWSLWLSAKGRVIALFALLRAGPEELIAWLPDFPATELADRLLRFRFRSKVAIEPLEGIHASGFFAGPADLGLDAAGRRATVLRDDEGRLDRIALDMGGRTPRTLLLQTGLATQEVDADARARWRLEDIAHGLPRLSPAQADAFTPQMLGLERISAFSVKKGCYPGQEIVARTHFLGKNKRGLLRLALNRPVETGTALQSSDGANAEVVSTATDGERVEALAVAPLDAADASFRSEETGIETTPLPLLEGLAR